MDLDNMRSLGKYPTPLATRIPSPTPCFFRWPSLCIDENIIAVVPDHKLEAFTSDGHPVA
jgi:putative ATP-dependent endonuclease of the OLD family